MKQLTSFAVSVLTAAVLLSILPVYGEAQLYDDVLRLHVVAKSDSEEDQALKLQVRDAVLSCLQEAMDDCQSVEEALAQTEKRMEVIRCAAVDCLRKNGSLDEVTVLLGREKYPRRDYGTSVMPAGDYHSLRVVIGEGQGQNWWCVLFPTVCIRFAQADEETYIQAGFTPEEYRMITGAEGKLKVRFRILEILSEIFGFDY